VDPLLDAEQEPERVAALGVVAGVERRERRSGREDAERALDVCARRADRRRQAVELREEPLVVVRRGRLELPVLPQLARPLLAEPVGAEVPQRGEDQPVQERVLS